MCLFAEEFCDEFDKDFGFWSFIAGVCSNLETDASSSSSREIPMGPSSMRVFG
jgi:hypothetical protein